MVAKEIEKTRETNLALERNYMKTINLAKALLKNKKCLGFAFKFKNGKWYYQNDNDLGLDIDELNFTQPLVKKIYVYKDYYIYQVRGGFEQGENEKGLTYSQLLAVAKECHDFIIPLTEKEKKICKKYWGF